MFKYSKLILIVLICLVTFSIGYALLSSNIKVTGSAKIPEIDMNLSVTCGVITSDDPISKFKGSVSEQIVTSENGHTNEVANCSGLTGSYSVDFTLPGASQGFWYEVTNNSSFQVRLKNIRINTTGTNTNDILGGYLAAKDAKQNLTYSNIYSKSGVSGFILDLVDGEDITCDIHSDYCELGSGGKMTIVLFERSSSTSENNIMNANVSRTFDFLFEQHND